jgi:hypothetical protein
MTFDTTAYYGQPAAMLPLFMPPGLFGGLPGQYGPLAEQLLAAHLGFQPLGGVLGGMRPQPRFSPFDIALLSLMQAPPAGLPWAGGLPGQYGQMIGSWPGQHQLGAFGQHGSLGSPQAHYGLPGAIGAWLASPLPLGSPFQQLQGNPFLQQLQGNPFLQQLQGNPFLQQLQSSPFLPPFGHQLGAGMGRFQPYQAVPQASYAG